MTPSISIFIVNFNTRDLLERCLTSIFETKGDLTLEVFVADNNSSDGSAEMVETKFPEVSLVRHSQNMGYTKAINPLLSLAKGEYYLLLHSDLEILPNTMEQFVDFFESSPQAGILGGNLCYPDGTPNPCEVLWPGFKNDLLSFVVRVFRKTGVEEWLLGHARPIEWSHESTSKVPSVWNACMMVRREVFETLGYFDDRFFVWYADCDLCKRATDAGWAVCYLYPATAIHHERNSFAGRDIIMEEILYKVNGWHSTVGQMRDRNTFLRKHRTKASIYAVKSIYVIENVLRLWLILGNLLFGRLMLEEGTFQLKACLRTIQAILSS